VLDGACSLEEANAAAIRQAGLALAAEEDRCAEICGHHARVGRLSRAARAVGALADAAGEAVDDLADWTLSDLQAYAVTAMGIQAAFMLGACVVIEAEERVSVRAACLLVTHSRRGGHSCALFEREREVTRRGCEGAPSTGAPSPLVRAPAGRQCGHRADKKGEREGVELCAIKIVMFSYHSRLLSLSLSTPVRWSPPPS